MNRMNSTVRAADRADDATQIPAAPASIPSFAAGAICAVIIILGWYLLALARVVPGPSLKLLGALGLPLVEDLAGFALHSVSQNFMHLVLAGLLLAWFEAAFRRCLAEGRSPAQVAALFKTLALLAGIFSLAISLPGTLERAMPSGAAKTAIGYIYFKLSIWVLAAICILIRQIRFASASNPRAQ